MEAFDREFRLKILSLCIDDEWMDKYSTIIKPEYFEQADEIAFVKAVLTFRQKYGSVPYDSTDVVHLTNGQYSSFVLDVFEDYGDLDTRLASDEIIRFAREQAAKIAILDSVDDVTSGNIQIAIDRMKEALSVGEDLSDMGINPFEDINMWLYDYWEDKVPTRLNHIDRILEGGLSKGELGVVLAPPNRGKSTTLVNIGYGAASIGSNKNVLHLTHEMSVKQVAKRYAARTVFRFPRPTDNLDEYAEELIEAARRMIVGKIKIIGGARRMSTEQVVGHIERLRRKMDIGLIIDDYPDLLEPRRKFKERRHELTDLFTFYRELSGEYDCPVWVATQARREALSKELITMADVAEDIGKAQVSDIIIALCQTRDEKMADQCRLYLAKVRDNPSGGMIEAKYYPSSQAIVTTGIWKPRQETEDA